jgi:hypothetical protein
MANPILNLLGGPLKGVIDGIGLLIDKVSTTDAERLEAKKQMLEIQSKLYTAALQADADIAKSKADVIKAEATSESWLTRNWRPIVMMLFATVVAHNYLLSPWFGLPRIELPPDMWRLLELGLGGYVVGRSVEKIIPSVAEAVGEVSRNRKAK